MLLSPSLASTLADAVYGIMDINDIRQGTAERLGMVNPGQAGPQPIGSYEMLDNFDVAGGAVAGQSGVSMLSKKTGFGMVLHGKGNYAGDVAVVCRGTAAGQDWLSNFNAATDIGPGGLPVHAGFNRVYRSMATEVNAALRGTNPTHVHVIGHSLGGAIANIFAAQFAMENRGGVQLYTFGAPRPGYSSFSDYLNSAVGPNSIKRVYAMADVVPMVPIWPFFHAPKNPGGLRVTRGGNGFSISAHFMDNYRPAVRNESWASLASSSRQVQDFKSVDYWISQANQASSIPFSGTALWALGKALHLILALAERVIGGIVTTTLTVVDQFAMLLARAASLARDIGTMLSSFIAAVFRAVGRTYNTAQEMTTGFLSYVLQLLYNSIASIARRSLAAISRR